MATNDTTTTGTIVNDLRDTAERHVANDGAVHVNELHEQARTHREFVDDLRWSVGIIEQSERTPDAVTNYDGTTTERLRDVAASALVDSAVDDVVESTDETIAVKP